VPVSGLLLIVGGITVLWGKWALPRQLSRVRDRLAADSRDGFDAWLGSRVTRRLLAMPAVCGGLVIGSGLFLLLTR
jgi:hypothetical protein